MTLYRDEYNQWLATIPYAIRQLVYVVKRYFRPEIGTDRRTGFSVDIGNGRLGNELKYNDEKLLTYYMRVGFTPDLRWRIFSLRSDFVPAGKVQAEDDITASVVVPERLLQSLNSRDQDPMSFKIVSSENPERRPFQPPDEAIHRGFDKQTERDFSKSGNFFSNFEPLLPENAQKILCFPDHIR